MNIFVISLKNGLKGERRSTFSMIDNVHAALRHSHGFLSDDILTRLEQILCMNLRPISLPAIFSSMVI